MAAMKKSKGKANIQVNEYRYHEETKGTLKQVSKIY